MSVWLPCNGWQWATVHAGPGLIAVKNCTRSRLIAMD
jgi:hypothetical protein